MYKSGGLVDKMIQQAGSQAKSREATRRAALEERRQVALRRIGAAAEKHDLNLAQNMEDERMLYDCLWRAQRTRISQAEAMAELAECCGDFKSELYWWEIKAGADTVLWKGYVIDKHTVFHYDMGPGGRRGSDFASYERENVRVIIRRMTSGGYLAECRSKEGNVSIGQSHGDEANPRHAAVAAFKAYVISFSNIEGYDFEKDSTDFAKELDRNLAKAVR